MTSNRTTRCLVCLGTALLALSTTCPCQSQDSNQPSYLNSYYLHVSYGWGGDGSAFQLHGVAQTSKKTAINFGIVGTAKVNGIFPTSYSRAVDTYFLNFGGMHKNENFIFRYGAGPSLNKVYYYGKPGFLGGVLDQTKNGVLGLVIDIEGDFGGGFAGVSSSLFVNINNEFTYGGFTLGLVLGRVIKKRQ